MDSVVKDNCVVTIAYSLRADDGTLLADTALDGPYEYLHGANNIVLGLELALTGKAVGDSFSAHLTPEMGYGEVDDDLIQEVDRSFFDDGQDLKEGMVFEIEEEDHSYWVMVASVKGDVVVIDGNHPLAGVSLQYDVTVQAIREATAEEIEQGHIYVSSEE